MILSTVAQQINKQGLDAKDGTSVSFRAGSIPTVGRLQTGLKMQQCQICGSNNTKTLTENYTINRNGKRLVITGCKFLHCNDCELEVTEKELNTNFKLIKE